MGIKLKTTAAISTVLLSDLIVTGSAVFFVWIVFVRVLDLPRVGHVLMLVPLAVYPVSAVVQLAKFPRLVRDGRAAEIRRADAWRQAESRRLRPRPSRLPQAPQTLHADADGT
jgi:hypothetical protein